jgi:hypothetical protein
MLVWWQLLVLVLGWWKWGLLQEWAQREQC